MFDIQLTNDFVGNKKLGQYMTPNNIKEVVFKLLPPVFGDVLEPSAGTGEFIYSIQQQNNLINLDCCELDTDLYKHLQQFGIPVFNDDFLTATFLKKYDFIIGNPPYFEFKMDKTLSNLYGDIANGRVNIYSLFIKKSIDLLKDNGYIAFVIPTSLNTSIYFEKIRQYIITHTNIECIYTFDDPSLFKKANQHVQIIILKKTKNKGDNFITIKDRTFFTNKNDAVKLFTNFISIKDMGLKVETGKIVWNTVKDLLTNDDTKTMLVWSKNISKDNHIVTHYDEIKKQYINKQAPYTEAIVVNRIIGSKKQIRAASICGNFFAENHVNVITGDTKKLAIILESFKDHRTIECLKVITNNSQLSKDELENYLPIFVSV